MTRILSQLVVLGIVSFITVNHAWSDDFSILQESGTLLDSTLRFSSASQLGVEAAAYPLLPAIPSEQEQPSESVSPFKLRGAGSAKELKGQVCVEHIFLDSPNAKWEPKKREGALLASAAAFRQLREMAAVRGITLRFSETQRVRESDSIFPVASFSQSMLAQYLVPRSVWVNAELSSCPDVVCDHKIQLVHVAKVGHSFAIAQNRDSETLDGDEVESAVLYLRRRQVGYYYDPEVEIAEIEQVERPAVFAHEVLHLFGAEDLYKPMARKAFSEVNYSSDIMLHNDRLLETMTIDAYTRYLIGWSDIPPAELP